MRSHRNVFEILSKFLVQVIVIIMILSNALMQTNLFIYLFIDVVLNIGSNMTI